MPIPELTIPDLIAANLELKTRIANAICTINKTKMELDNCQRDHATNLSRIQELELREARETFTRRLRDTGVADFTVFEPGRERMAQDGG